MFTKNLKLQKEEIIARNINLYGLNILFLIILHGDNYRIFYTVNKFK